MAPSSAEMKKYQDEKFGRWEGRRIRRFVRKQFPTVPKGHEAQFWKTTMTHANLGYEVKHAAKVSAELADAVQEAVRRHQDCTPADHGVTS